MQALSATHALYSHCSHCLARTVLQAVGGQVVSVHTPTVAVTHLYFYFWVYIVIHWQDPHEKEIHKKLSYQAPPKVSSAHSPKVDNLLEACKPVYSVNIVVYLSVQTHNGTWI